MKQLPEAQVRPSQQSAPIKEELSLIAIQSKYLLKDTTQVKVYLYVDAFKGNSGSAMFSEATGSMIGVLFKGNPDYVYNNRLGCREPNVCRNTECRGEDASHISSIWPLISPFLKNQ